MLGRIGLLGRIMLILMAALTAVIVAAIAIGYVERGSAPPSPLGANPRLEQAAGAIDLLARLDPAERPTALRAVSGTRVVATIKDAPPDPAGYRRLARSETILRALSETIPRAESGQDDGLRVFADGDAKGNRPARIVARLADGHYLVIDEIETPRKFSLTLFGLAPGFWIGILGIAVAGLALLGAQREMRPLRRLSAAAEAFDGSPPASPVPVSGAPDVQRLVRAVHAMQERVAALLQERSFLIGAISHDLKTYLTRLRLRAESWPDPVGRDRMAADIDTMTDLIETSLAFARGTTVSQIRGRVDLADLAAVEAAERSALGQPVALASDDTAEATVPGDAVALRRVVANLVDNAVKFGRERVEIALESGPQHCSLRVEDDGPGVGALEAAAIFSPFYRIEGSRNRQTGGSGLGLAIARQIAEAHGGSIAVCAGRLGGACFTLTLPRAGG
ncbi:sensor histidine kinase [Methylobacterium aerolatum]|uniref:histidine kinase n=1 Tax=Methylobacterium aerolatum TaxID=418708 RepID=A0ABU0I428_9HYPH|nr:HAMP domain-containing sensor histidine kinase [Methylobacterium aerolatum]MDQ0449361.1 signal transduction histidine kinase [Methylobacterium aerolatum]GJD36690.1 Adaptive-response sensory-kinase SasA [Methylobacterium aerolatum]